MQLRRTVSTSRHLPIGIFMFGSATQKARPAGPRGPRPHLATEVPVSLTQMPIPEAKADGSCASPKRGARHAAPPSRVGARASRTGAKHRTTRSQLAVLTAKRVEGALHDHVEGEPQLLLVPHDGLARSDTRSDGTRLSDPLEEPPRASCFHDARTRSASRGPIDKARTCNPLEQKQIMQDCPLPVRGILCLRASKIQLFAHGVVAPSQQAITAWGLLTQGQILWTRCDVHGHRNNP